MHLKGQALHEPRNIHDEVKMVIRTRLARAEASGALRLPLTCIDAYFFCLMSRPYRADIFNRTVLAVSCVKKLERTFVCKRFRAIVATISSRSSTHVNE